MPPEAAGARACLNCGETFRIDAEEVRWFFARGLSLPRRCRRCRAERKAPRPIVGAGPDARYAAARPHRRYRPE
jgi:hypothetical protein